ncbi:dienelactone hydrolase family protein [Paenibacillus sp. y28]|uniref:dienelactone hydrolase family protein n=1 Tax=Paenibacillus sp. y28 TaxID=3129110 RepID=UPI00301ABB2B
MWGPDAYLEHLNEKAYKEYRKKTEESWLNRKSVVRTQLVKVLGGFPAEGGALEPEVLERIEREDHVVERVAFSTEQNLRMLAYVLVPKGLKGKAPAVLAWHGHGHGSREVIGIRPDGSFDDSGAANPGHFALELVRRGLIVVAPEIIGFGDRRLASDQAKDPTRNSSCAPLAARLLLHGKTLAGLRIYEARRTLDYILTRSDVNTARIGCAGFSGGGLVAAFSAALDNRIQAVVLCAFTSTFRGSLLARGHCIDNYLPGMLSEADLPDLIGLTAPRSLFVESGELDPLFPVDSVREAVRRLQEIYVQEEAEGRLQSDLFPGKHEVSGRASFDWLANQLKA